MDYVVREFKLCILYAKEITQSLYFATYMLIVSNFMRNSSISCLNVYMLPSVGVNSFTLIVSTRFLIKNARIMLDNYLLVQL